VLVAERQFEESEGVGVEHVSLGQKNTCVAESYPAQIDVDRYATVDVCRGKSKGALRELLSAVHDFFEAWASFQIQMVKLNNGGRGYLSCCYTLRLPVAPDEGVCTKIGNVDIQGKDTVDQKDGAAWIRPTEEMCKSWGYETKEKHSLFPNDGETVVIVCQKT